MKDSKDDHSKIAKKKEELNAELIQKNQQVTTLNQQLKDANAQTSSMSSQHAEDLQQLEMKLRQAQVEVDSKMSKEKGILKQQLDDAQTLNQQLQNAKTALKSQIDYFKKPKKYQPKPKANPNPQDEPSPSTAWWDSKPKIAALETKKRQNEKAQGDLQKEIAEMNETIGLLQSQKTTFTNGGRSFQSMLCKDLENSEVYTQGYLEVCREHANFDKYSLNPFAKQQSTNPASALNFQDERTNKQECFIFRDVANNITVVGKDPDSGNQKYLHVFMSKSRESFCNPFRESFTEIRTGEIQTLVTPRETTTKRIGWSRAFRRSFVATQGTGFGFTDKHQKIAFWKFANSGKSKIAMVTTGHKPLTHSSHHDVIVEAQTGPSETLVRSYDYKVGEDEGILKVSTDIAKCDGFAEGFVTVTKASHPNGQIEYKCDSKNDGKKIVLIGDLAGLFERFDRAGTSKVSVKFPSWKTATDSEINEADLEALAEAEGNK